jgi:DNA-binding response OmpR family regulator
LPHAAPPPTTLSKFGQLARKGTQQNGDGAKGFFGTPKVLIFDVDIEDLARHAKPFEAHGFEVHKCMSVETAMRCVEREELDFAVLDQGSSSFEGLRIIRHLVRYNIRTPFVVVTRCRDILCRQEALALGAVDYLEKPVPTEEMNWIIRNYLGSSLKKEF